MVSCDYQIPGTRVDCSIVTEARRQDRHRFLWSFILYFFAPYFFPGKKKKKCWCVHVRIFLVEKFCLTSFFLCRVEF